MNKKGFTLAELLAVIVVLAIIVGIAGISAITVMNRAKEKTFREMEDNLKDAAITCYLDTKDIENCNTPEILVKNNFFEDDKKYCLKKNIKIIIDKDEYTASITGKCGS